MTRTEIENLAVGMKLANTMDIEAFTGFRKLKADARWSEAREIVEITFRGVSVKGDAYVGGYTTHGGNGSTISFSISEGENHYRIG